MQPIVNREPPAETCSCGPSVEGADLHLPIYPYDRASDRGSATSCDRRDTSEGTWRVRSITVRNLFVDGCI